jgi:hypothetical protein
MDYSIYKRYMFSFDDINVHAGATAGAKWIEKKSWPKLELRQATHSRL